MCSIGTRPADTDGPGVTRCPRRGPSTARDASAPLGQQGRAGGRSREARCGAGRARLPFTAHGDRRMLQPRGVGGPGLPAGRWLPATPGRLGEHAWRERPWPRNALRDLTRATPLGLVSPTCGRASVTPAFLGRFQGRTAADFSEGPGSKEVWKRRQRSRGDWGGRTGRRPGQGGHGPPPVPWPLWTWASRQSGRVPLPPGALSELRGEQGAQEAIAVTPPASDACGRPLVRPRCPPAPAGPSLGSRPRGPHWKPHKAWRTWLS